MTCGQQRTAENKQQQTTIANNDSKIKGKPNKYKQERGLPFTTSQPSKCKSSYDSKEGHQPTVFSQTPVNLSPSYQHVLCLNKTI